MYSLTNSELNRTLYNWHRLDRIRAKIDYARIRISNKELCDYLEAQKDMELWTREDYEKVELFKPKVKEPVIINRFVGYPSFEPLDILIGLSEWEKRKAEIEIAKVSNDIKNDINSFITKWIYVKYRNIFPEITLTKYGVISVNINPYSRYGPRDYIIAYKFMLTNTYNDFISSYKGLHALSSYVVKGSKNLISYVQIRSL